MSGRFRCKQGACVLKNGCLRGQKCGVEIRKRVMAFRLK